MQIDYHRYESLPLFTSPLSLDLSGSLILLVLSAVDLHFSKLLPENFKFLVVLFNVIGIVDNNNIFLVALASLNCPVERSSDEMSIINDNKLIVHVELWAIICPDCDALLTKPMNITSLVGHALIIGDYADLNSSLMGSVQSIC